MTFKEVANLSLEKMFIAFVENQIDDPANLKNQPVFVGVDALDNIISPTYEIALRSFYENTDVNLKSEDYQETH